MQKHTTIYFK